MSQDRILEKRIGENVSGAAPVVSVIVPAYNVAEFIAETLDSVLAQTFRDYEIILVNDGSPDSADLEAVLEKYFRTLIYIKQENAGTASARNTAIKAARGEWLAFLDGDDVWFPEYLEAQIKALEIKNCDLIYADALLFGSVRDETETYMIKSPSRGAVTPESLLEGSCNVITSGTVARREKVVGCGAFDEELPRIGMEDYDLWFRLAKTGARLDYQLRVLLKYRVRAGSLSGSNVQRAQRSLTGLDILAKKYQLTEAEKKVMAKSRTVAQAELELEKGKFHLVRGDFAEAGASFRRANRHYRKFKLLALGWLIKFQPKLVLKIFQKMRSAEFTFIAQPEAAKKPAGESAAAAAAAASAPENPGN